MPPFLIMAQYFCKHNLFTILLSVKRVFPIIIFLIGLSLIGTIYIQIMWLKNMLLLQQEQVKHKLEVDVSKVVADELMQGKSLTPSARSAFPGFEDFSIEPNKPYSIGSRFTAQEIYEKIRLAFAAQHIENIPFE